MTELETLIRGHIFELKERFEDIFALEEYFEFTPEDLETLARDLKKSVEGGVLEYKKRTISSAFTFMESLKYDSKGFDRLATFVTPLTSLVFIVLTQRLIAKGTLRISEQKPEDTEGQLFEEKDLSIQEILSDVQQRIKQSPEAEKDQRIKSILLQVRQYRSELEKKKSLEPNILPDKRPAFEENYKKIFDELLNKIRTTYYTVLKSDETKPATAAEKKLSDYDLPQLEGVYRKQIEYYSSLRSTMIYAVKERYNIREIFADLEQKWSVFFKLLDDEYKKALLIAPFEGEVKHLFHLYTAACIRIIKRHASLL